MEIARIDAVVKMTGLSKSSVWRKVKAGEFPSPIKLGPQARGWPQNEILAWVQARISERDGAACQQP
jgi:prophage regulatory protein